MANQNNGRVILIAEDDEDHYLLTKEALEEARVDRPLEWVQNGEQLMDYLFQRGSYAAAKNYPRPALIVLDLNLPKKDGREALKEIHSHLELCRIPVVVLTTSGSEEDITHSYQLGASAYIKKPASFEELVRVMKVLKEYWFETVALPRT